MIAICFGGSHVCLVSGEPTEGAWVWSAGGSHLGVSWNQEVSVTGNNSDPIAKGVNHRGEENPSELAEPEQAGGRRAGKKPTNSQVQQTVGAQPQVQQVSIPKAHS